MFELRAHTRYAVIYYVLHVAYAQIKYQDSFERDQKLKKKFHNFMIRFVQVNKCGNSCSN